MQIMMLIFLAYYYNMSIMRTSIYIYLDVYDIIYKIEILYIGNHIDLSFLWPVKISLRPLITAFVYDV